MSHNSKYYAKKIRSADVTGSKKILQYYTAKTKSSSDSTAAATTSVTEKITSEHEHMDECPTAAGSSSTATAEIELSASKPSMGQTKDPDSSDSDSCESDGEFESDLKRKRLVDQRLFDGSKYEELYPWLYFSMLKGGYLCKYCELFSVGKKLFTETGVILGDHPSRKLDKHSSTNRHQEATKKYTQVNSDALKKKKSVLLLLHESSKSQKEEERLRNREVFKKLFRITYFLIRKEWAQANFEDLVRFIASLGVADLQQHLDTADPSATYLSSTTETELIQIIGEVIERQLLGNLRNSNFYTLLADESTDEQNREQLSLFAKWLTGCNEMPTDHFLGIVHVEKTDSETLLNAIQQFLIAKNIDVTKCKFVGFDGTNAMSGEVSGLQRRMRHLSPMCLYINCRNHRLALCLKHLMKQYPLLVEADSLLLSIWKMFHYSPRKFEVFRNIQALYGEDQMTLIRAATTRWLSHGKASIRLIEKYQPVLDTLDALYGERHEPEIFGLRCNLTDKNIIAMILVLCDVLKPVNILSLYLQSPTICFSEVETQVKVTCNELEGLIASFQTRDNDTYFSKIESIFEEIADRTDLQRRLRTNFNITPDEFLEKVATPFIYSLIGEITDAFHCHPVFKAFAALDPDNLPVTPADIIEHGKETLEVLLNHYASPKTDIFKGHTNVCVPDVDRALAAGEYQGYKQQMFVQRSNGKCQSPMEVFNFLMSNDALQKCNKNILLLLELMIIMPTSTASVERGFSLMNRLCTPLRNRLTQVTLESIMRICMEGPQELENEMLEQMVNLYRDKKDRAILL